MLLASFVALLTALVCAWGQQLETGPSLPSECVLNPDKACIRKCCPLGQSIVGRDCGPSNLTLQLFYLNETTPADPESYVLAFGNPCKSDRYRLDPKRDTSDLFFLLPNGLLEVPQLYGNDQLGPSNFCLETFSESNDTRTLPLICFSESSRAEIGVPYIIYPIGLLISIPFLLATVLVYIFIPELRDLNGKALVCYCSCLTVAYLSLAIVQLGSNNFNNTSCVTFAYIIQFSFTACFLWLNVLCIDTFWCVLTATGTFSFYPGLRRWQWLEKDNAWVRMDNLDLTEEEERQRRADEHLFTRKVFAGYSLYAWTLPVICIAFTITMDFSPAVPAGYIKPNMGMSKCWFDTKDAALSYFYGPVGFILAINLSLFVITVYKMVTFNWNARGPHRTPKQKARMCLMLFVVMGISWVMELVSWAVGGAFYMWTATDVINTMQGVIIFVIFVLEQRAKFLVKTKLLPQLRAAVQKLCCRGSSSESVPPAVSQERSAILSIGDYKDDVK